MVTLPVAAAAPCDFAFMFDARGGIFLVYEIARDFLSTPRSFVGLEFQPGADGWVYLRDVVDEDVHHGLEIISEHPWHLVFCSGEQILELNVAQMRHHGIFYQHAGASQVLLDVMQRQNNNE